MKGLSGWIHIGICYGLVRVTHYWVMTLMMIIDWTVSLKEGLFKDLCIKYPVAPTRKKDMLCPDHRMNYQESTSSCLGFTNERHIFS